tara:strand:+ start:133 stop:990 length:858 start_codon:yes stop_codon:yes gene_type:complete
MNKSKAYTSILFIGLTLGALMAGFSVIQKSNIVNYQWAAKIEDTSIPMEKYLVQLEGLAKDKRSPITQSDKEYVLERMIEEELLIKRALDLGMLDNNPMARGTIVQQMIKTIISENQRYEVTEEELKEFFVQNTGFFTKSSRLRIRQIYFSEEDFKELTFEESYKAYDLLLEGKSFDEVSKFGSISALKIPNSLMTLTKVREYVGPSIMNIANSLVPGSFTQPIKVSGGYKIIYLLEKEAADKPAFKLIRDSVLAEFLKRRDDNSLRQYLDNLKKWYDVSRNLPD